MSTLSPQPALAPAPFCFNCGYDLTGLELPRPCPECGRVADPPREIEEARQWFFKEAWKPWALLRPSRIPLALWHSLDDVASRRVARRWRRLCVWLPATLVLFVVVTGYMFERESIAALVTYSANSPTATPLHRLEGKASRRLFYGETGQFPGNGFASKNSFVQ